MSKKGMFSAAAAALITTGLLASAASAASMTPAQTCVALQKQWDSVTTKASTANAVSARKLATTAASDCKAGKPKTAVADYRKALRAIGEKPKY